MIKLLRSLNIKALNRDELLMLLNLFHLLRGLSLMDELNRIIEVIDESEELRERLEALNSSLALRKFEEKHVLEGGSVYFYKTKTKVFINPQTPLNLTLKTKVEHLLSQDFKKIIITDGTLEKILEKSEVINYIESRSTNKLTLFLHK